MAKPIPITADYLRSRIKYDPESGAISWRPIPVRTPIDKMWNTRFAGSAIEARNSRDGYIRFSIDRTSYLAHRAIWLLTHGVWPEQQIDHVNGIRWDNRLANLRAANRAQNAANTPFRKKNKTGYRGVWFQNGKWHASIGHNYATIHIGAFDAAEEAAAAYDRNALALQGEFAILNFPEG